MEKVRTIEQLIQSQYPLIRDRVKTWAPVPDLSQGIRKKSGKEKEARRRGRGEGGEQKGGEGRRLEQQGGMRICLLLPDSRRWWTWLGGQQPDLRASGSQSTEAMREHCGFHVSQASYLLGMCSLFVHILPAS